ncbi:alpha/beta hydrolase [Fodinibius halophilus]|uniref:Alpha/beta hydrolase n=1 Tax=Fodinibius halophilus TaxID=1736908 RepID=A0A6M1T5C5_9BACT|nr:alpha/beta hydrolase [Fodinibius halophilus]NGP89289.1 alpha/beta hydrolase [Fodinibius halophilus]
MFLISSRREFTNNREFSDTDMLRFVGGMQNQVLTTEEFFLSDISSKKILLIVHGFNTPFSYIVPEYLRMKEQYNEQLSNHYDYIVGYTWPSGGSEIDYFQAKKNTDTAANRLHSWICKLDRVECTIDIAGHSMAAMVGYKSLTKDAPIQVRNVFSFGAAIPKDLLSEEELLAQALGKVDHVYAFYNRKDHVLKYLFRFMEWEQALGYTGLQNYERLMGKGEKITAIDCTGMEINHTGYMRSEEITRFMEAVLEGHKRGPFIKLEKEKDMYADSSHLNRYMSIC